MTFSDAGSTPAASTISLVIWHLLHLDTYTDTTFRKGSPMANREVNITRRVQNNSELALLSGSAVGQWPGQA